jgi:hypothetical protein
LTCAIWSVYHLALQLLALFARRLNLCRKTAATPLWASDDRAEGPASTSIPCNFRVVVLLVAQSGHASSAPQCAFGGNADIG